MTINSKNLLEQAQDSSTLPENADSFRDAVKSALRRLTASETHQWKSLLGLPHIEFLDWPSRVVLSGNSVLTTFASSAISQSTIRELVGRPCWRSFEESEVEDLALHAVIAANPSTPTDISEALVRSDYWYEDDQKMVENIRSGSIYQPIIRRYSADEVQLIIDTGNVWKRRRLTESCDCPSEILPLLLVELNHERFATLDVSIDQLHIWSNSDNENIRAGVARHPNCPPEIRRGILDALIRNTTENESRNSGGLAASNPTCTEADLEALAETPYWEVLASVAVNPGCSSKLRKKLDKRLQSAFADVDDLSSGGVNFPSAAFQAMFKTKWLRELEEMGDPAEYNMHTIAKHPNWPWNDNEVLSNKVFLAYFAMWGVQECIWQDDYLGDRFLEPLVKYAIADNIEGTGSWGPCNVLAKMARSPHATPAWLRELAKESNRNSCDPQVRDNLTIAIAVNHPKFPAADRERLADGDALCRALRTSRFWASEIADLTADGHQALANGDPIWINPNAKLIKRVEEMPKVLRWICIAAGRASNIFTNRAATSVDWEERAAAASSCKISTKALRKLATDPNRIVSDCARVELIRRKTADSPVIKN